MNTQVVAGEENNENYRIGMRCLRTIMAQHFVNRVTTFRGWLRVPQNCSIVNLVETDGSIFNESLTASDPDFLATSDLLR